MKFYGIGYHKSAGDFKIIRLIIMLEMIEVYENVNSRRRHQPARKQTLTSDKVKGAKPIS